MVASLNDGPLIKRKSNQMLSEKPPYFLIAGANGIVIRTVYPQVPPKVEYSLSDYGKTLIPIMDSLSGWGQSHVERDNDDDLQVGR
jgi:hypothetical protein